MSGHAFRFRAEGGLEGPEAALMWEFGCRGIAQEGEELVAYFDAPVDLPVEGRWEALPEVDYLAEYYRSLGPIDLGALVIAPTHATAELRAGQKVLWLDPGMAFGTGHHESTRLALEELTRLEPGGRRVLDVGAGSGILAIAADLLGAVAAIGVDNDPATVPIARANARLNRSRAEFLEGTLADAPGAGSFDLLLANLYAELHAQLAREYAQALTPDGVVIASGIMLDRAELARTALASAFAAVTERRTGEWVMLRAEGPLRP